MAFLWILLGHLSQLENFLSKMSLPTLVFVMHIYVTAHVTMPVS